MSKPLFFIFEMAFISENIFIAQKKFKILI